MRDPFEPFDTRDYVFGTGYPFEDPMDPINDTLDPFGTSLEAVSEPIVTSGMPNEPIPGPGLAADPAEALPGLVDDVMEPFDVGAELFEQTSDLDDSARLGGGTTDKVDLGSGPLDPMERLIFGCEADGIEPFDSVVEKFEPELKFEKLSEKLGLKVSDLIKMEQKLDVVGLTEGNVIEISKPASSRGDDTSLNECESSIEGNEVKQIKFWPDVEAENTEYPEPGEERRERIMGASSPDMNIIEEPKRIYERQFKAKLWKPRRYSSNKKAQIFKRKKEFGENTKIGNKGGFRQGKSTWEVINFIDCEMCEYLKNGRCTLQVKLTETPTENSIKLDPELIDEYVGEYRVRRLREKFEVWRKENKLYIRAFGEDIELFFKTENRFIGIWKGFGSFEICFVRDKDGNVRHLVFHLGIIKIWSYRSNFSGYHVR